MCGRPYRPEEGLEPVLWLLSSQRTRLRGEGPASLLPTPAQPSRRPLCQDRVFSVCFGAGTAFLDFLLNIPYPIALLKGR